MLIDYVKNLIMVIGVVLCMLLAKNPKYTIYATIAVIVLYGIYYLMRKLDVIEREVSEEKRQKHLGFANKKPLVFFINLVAVVLAIGIGYFCYNKIDSYLEDDKKLSKIEKQTSVNNLYLRLLEQEKGIEEIKVMQLQLINDLEKINNNKVSSPDDGKENIDSIKEIEQQQEQIVIKFEKQRLMLIEIKELLEKKYKQVSPENIKEINEIKERLKNLEN